MHVSISQLIASMSREVEKWQRTNKAKHNMCTDISDRMSGTRMDSLRPSDLKKEESINRVSVILPLVLDVCVRVCVCVSIEFLFVAFASCRLKLARKSVLGLSSCPFVFVSRLETWDNSHRSDCGLPVAVVNGPLPVPIFTYLFWQ